MKVLLSLMFISSFAFAQYAQQQAQQQVQAQPAITQTAVMAATPELSAAPVSLTYSAEALAAPATISQEAITPVEANDSVEEISTWKNKTKAQKLASLKAHLASKSGVSDSEILYKNFCAGTATASSSSMCAAYQQVGPR